MANSTKSILKFLGNRFWNKLQCTCKVNSIAKSSTIFSGIQPTGTPHLGNYFGAIRKWTALQNEGHNCIFSIADLHAITLPQDPKKLRHHIQLMTASLLACGIDPEKSILFQQSQVPQHTELSWILGCFSTKPEMETFPQYKEKSGGSSDSIPLGLFNYPILQSADILLYKANSVPVGEDQLRHIQSTKHLVKKFNNIYGEIFPFPEPLIDQNSARIKSLRRPEKKMSKSDTDFKNRIELTDSPDIVTKRIKEAFTDHISAVTYDPNVRPGVSNLILIHSLCTGKSHETICEESRLLDTGAYKLVVARDVVEYLEPIQKRIQDLMSNPSYIASVLKKGSERASEIASRTMEEVKSAMGLSPEK